MKQILRYFLLLFFLLGISECWSQKLVIGSQRPSMRGIQWQNKSPKLNKPLLIEFYHHDNSSSREFLDLLSEIKQQSRGNLEIVILTRDGGKSLAHLNQYYGDEYLIGYDPTGAVFSSFGVKYIPYSILSDRKGNLLWIGNLSSFDMDLLKP